MDIYVLNLSGTPLGLVESRQSVIWNMQYFGYNDLQLVTAATPTALDLLQVGNLLVRDVDMSNGEYHNVMMIEKREVKFDVEAGWLLTITGKGLKNILSRRIVWSQVNTTGTVEDAIRQVITDNVISPSDSNRAIPNFILAPSMGATDEAEIQLLGDNIAEWLESVCTTYGYGWDVYLANGNYVFMLYQGTDRTYNSSTPVVFSPDYDNLYSSTYSYDLSTFGNVGLVGGEGDGINMRTTTVGNASGLDRYEKFIDGSSVSSNGEIITVETYMKLLESFGNEEIKQYQLTQSFDGEIEPNGMYKLNVDYFLGDIVQVESNGIKATPRITEIIYSEDANGTSIVPTFSEWEVS